MAKEIEFRARISKSGNRYLIKIPAKLEHVVKPYHEKREWVLVKITLGDPPNNN